MQRPARLMPVHSPAHLARYNMKQTGAISALVIGLVVIVVLYLMFIY